ncbi:PREDICTED: uncharacterized protein LOC105590223 isoform X6 [Cercocebus atys]|uniref:uncharacterized protein LOC105590223 isoform X6 n=1 Tax=Cercocebus atys TaxID=9531 RepID=UPI0005F468F2|nr:PREDICTED: uncharacterized protein LOC105590223 isoform X6 [Cercocebus atys]
MKRNFYWERMEVKRHGEKEAGECIKEGRFLHAGPGGGRGDERAEGTTGESRARRSRPARMNREAHYWVITTIPSPRLIPADHGRNPELPLFTCNCLQHNPHLRITRFSPFMKGCSSQVLIIDDFLMLMRSRTEKKLRHHKHQNTAEASNQMERIPSFDQSHFPKAGCPSPR